MGGAVGTHPAWLLSRHERLGGGGGRPRFRSPWPSVHACPSFAFTSSLSAWAVLSVERRHLPTPFLGWSLSVKCHCLYTEARK